MNSKYIVMLNNEKSMIKGMKNVYNFIRSIIGNDFYCTWNDEKNQSDIILNSDNSIIGFFTLDK